jgi:hypothetical protein
VLAAPVVSGAFNYNNLIRVGNDWVLQSEAAGQNPTPVFTPVAASFEALSQSLITMATLPSLISRTNGRIGGNELVGCLPPIGGNSPAGELFVPFAPSIGAFGGGKLLMLDKAGGSARARAS